MGASCHVTEYQNMSQENFFYSLAQKLQHRLKRNLKIKNI